MSENQQETEKTNDIARCKTCNSIDIYRDNLVCQTVKTGDVTVMPMFICKGCSGGMIVAADFQVFAKKILSKVNEKKDQITTQVE